MTYFSKLSDRPKSYHDSRMSECWAHSSDYVGKFLRVFTNIACLRRYRGFKFRLKVGFMASFTTIEPVRRKNNFVRERFSFIIAMDKSTVLS